MIIMISKSKISSERAFKEACKKNGLIFNKHDKGNKAESVKLLDEDGNCFKLNNDLSIDKCCLEDKDNDFAVTKDVATGRSEPRKGFAKNAHTGSKKKSAYKMQKGLQKA